MILKINILLFHSHTSKCRTRDPKPEDRNDVMHRMASSRTHYPIFRTFFWRIILTTWCEVTSTSYYHHTFNTIYHQFRLNKLKRNVLNTNGNMQPTMNYLKLHKTTLVKTYCKSQILHLYGEAVHKDCDINTHLNFLKMIYLLSYIVTYHRQANI